MWELNDNLNIHKHQIMGSTVYEVEDVYKFPKKVKRWLFSRETPLWKMNEPNSLNGKEFLDRRLVAYRKDAVPLMELCSKLSNQSLVSPNILTNVTQFVPSKYNDRWRTHYWWPHRDDGYNGICYFDETDEVNGTNLYHPDTPEPSNVEHQDPWIPKDQLKLVHTFKPKFNKLVLFDGSKFPHGMAINDDRYFTKSRINQPIFMKAP